MVFFLKIEEDSSHDVCFEMQIPMVNQSTGYFSICNNGANRPFVFAGLTSVNEMQFTNGIPID